MIPVLSYAQFIEGDKDAFVTKLDATCRDTGFFLLSDHGIDETLVARAFDQADEFFSLDPQYKDALDISLSPHNRGYARIGSESLDEKSGVMDLKEAFNIGLDLPEDDPRVVAGDAFRGVNAWPALPHFRETMLRYYKAVWALGVDLHRAISLGFGLDEAYFAPHFDAPMATLRVLHYPKSQAKSEGIGAGAHTDYGSLTLLRTDDVPGLQVKPRGRDWCDVPHVPGAFIVNIGDCLMRWSNNIYVSTPHRVLVPKAKRTSIAFFLDPNPDSVVQALPGTGTPLYEPVTGADYLMQRLTATYANANSKTEFS